MEAETMKTGMIRSKKLHKFYEGKVKVHALRGVDLSIKKGEMVAIMGPSGCGKTTLLNCLSGLDDISKGKVWLKGKDLSSLSDNEKTEMRAMNMGFVFQFYNLLPVLSAVENVELPLLLAGKSKGAREKAEKALDMVGLGHRYTHRPSALSGGERQRVTIARAIVNEPDMIWADEPTGDLDTETSDKIMDILCDLNDKNGHTMVLVTHENRVADRAERVLHMESGVVQRDQIKEG
ncbi:MAG: ABC transporter ATP-binding protein [Candidatus Saliniplasma sp.]